MNLDRDTIANHDIPTGVPVRPMHPQWNLRARLVTLDGTEHWHDGTAIRWTDSHVMIKIARSTLGRTDPLYLWLRRADVLPERGGLKV